MPASSAGGGDNIEVGVTLKSDGSEEAFLKHFGIGMENTMTKAGKVGGKNLAAGLQTATQATNEVNAAVAKTTATTKVANEQFERMGKSLSLVDKASDGIATSLGQAFDPRALVLMNDQMQEAIRLRAALADRKDTLTTDEFRKQNRDIDILIKNLTLSKAGFSQAAQAAREFNSQTSKAAIEASRAQTAAQAAAKSKYVVDTQRAAASELATIRATAATTVASARATAKTRVAAFELAGRAIIASERGVRTAFQSTSNIVVAAFSAIGRAAQSASTTINTTLRSAVTNSNTAITNNYSSSWRKNSSIVNNELNQQTTNINKFASQAKQAISTVAQSASTIAIGGIAGAGVIKSLTSGFTRAANLEDAQRSFELFLGSAEKADALLKGIVDTVTGTPFKLDQFAQAAGQLLAFNFEAEKIPGILATVGDAAAASGGRANEMVGRLTLVLGQMSAAGKVSGGDMLQLTEASIPAWAILGNAMGKTTGELRKMVEKGLVPAAEATDILLDGIKNGSTGINGTTVAFEGLAKSLGTTMRGSLANLNTAFARAGANVIGKFAPTIVAGLAAATAGIDLLGKAFVSFADSVSKSPAFQFLADQVGKLGPILVSLKTTLQPVFDLLADGAVIVIQIAGAFALFKGLPTIFTTLGSALLAVVTPMNVLLVAGTVVAGLFTRLMKDSAAFRDALTDLGDAIEPAIKPAMDAIVAVFGAFRGVAGTAATAAQGFGDKVGQFLVDKLVALATFVRTTVTPAIKQFAGFVQSTVVPAIERFRDRVGELASSAFKTAVDFIQNTAIPVIGRGLGVAFDVASTAFEKFYSFAHGTLVPFIKGNLVPTLAALAATVGTLALTGSLPFAGLVAAAGAIGVALSNDNIRTALVNNIKKGVETARTYLKNLVDNGTLKAVAVNILKVANKIGETLGSIASDRRLLTAAAAIVAAGAALAASFALGFAKGVAENIPELIDALNDGLKKALEAAGKAILSSPLLAAGLITALVAALTGGAAFAKLRSAGMKTGQVVAEGMQSGMASAASVGSGTGGSSFIRGFFGTPQQLQAEATKAAAQASQIINDEFFRQQRVVQRLTGKSLPAIDGSRLKPDAEGLRAVSDEVKRLGVVMGPATVAGATFREGLVNIKDSFTVRDAAGMSAGFKQVGESLKTVGGSVVRNAGLVLGGAFVTAFGTQVLADMKSSGAAKFEAGLSIVASAATVGAIAGPQAAAASLGIGLLVGGIQSSGKRAAEAKQEIKAYTEAIKGAGTAAEEAAGAQDLFLDNIVNAGGGVRSALDDINFNYHRFLKLVTEGHADQALAEVGAKMDQVGVGGQRAFDAFVFLNQEADRLDAAQGLNTFRQGLIETAGASEDVADTLTLVKDRLDTAAAATQAMADAMEEVKAARVEELQQQVDDLSAELDDATSAANRARDAVAGFFRVGDNSGNAAILNTASSVEAMNDALANTSLTASQSAATINSAVNDIANQAGQILTEGVLNGSIIDQASAQAALQPLITAAYESGGEGGMKAIEAMNNQLATFEPTNVEFFKAVAVDKQADDVVRQLNGKFGNAKIKLDQAIDTDASQFQGAKEAAQAAFEEIAGDAVNGFTAMLSGDTEGAAAATAWSEGVIEAARFSFDAHSPSRVFEELGQGAADGFIMGITTGQAAAVAAVGRFGKAMQVPLAFLRPQFILGGIQAGTGLAIGMDASRGTVVAAAAKLARAALDTFKSIFIIASPSQAMRGVGINVGEGLAQGVTATTTAVRGAAVKVSGELMKGFEVGIEQEGGLVFTAVDKFGDEVQRKFYTVGQAIGESIGFGLETEGIGVLGSIDSILDEVAFSALSKVEQFGLIGQQLASALFGKMGSGGLFGSTGGSAQIKAQQKFLDLGKINTLFNDQFAKYGKFAPQFDTGNFVGRENRQLFLSAGNDIRDYASALIEAGRPLSNVVAETRAWRDSLANTARGFGATDAEINEMLTTLGLTDGQLDSFVSTFEQLNQQVAAGNTAAIERLRVERERVAAERERQRQEEADAEAKRKREEAEAQAREDEERAKKDAENKQRQIESRPPPVFRDIIINPPTGDPEAIALATANRVAGRVFR